MKTLQKISAQFFTESTSKFIYDTGLEDEMYPSAFTTEIKGEAAFVLNRRALMDFPEISNKITKLLEEAGGAMPTVGGICGESAALSLEKIRSLGSKTSKEIESALKELETAVKESGRERP
jgi:hypothetical protein